MDNLKTRRSVLEDIMKWADEKMAEPLKSKSPKFAKVEIESTDPSMAEELKEKMMSEEPTQEFEREEERPSDFEKPKLDVDSMSEEDREKLLELYERLKA